MAPAVVAGLVSQDARMVPTLRACQRVLVRSTFLLLQVYNRSTESDE